MTSTASLPDASSASAGVQGVSRAKVAGRNGGAADGDATSGFRDVLAGLDGERRTGGNGKSHDASKVAKLSVLAGRMASSDTQEEPVAGTEKKPDTEASVDDKSATGNVALLAEIWPAIQRSAQPPEKDSSGEPAGEAAAPAVLPSDDEMAASLPTNRAKVSVTHQEVHFEPTGLTSAKHQAAAADQASDGAANLSAIINGNVGKSHKAGNNTPADQASAASNTATETDTPSAVTGTSTAAIEAGSRERGEKDLNGREDRRVLAASAQTSTPADAASPTAISTPLTEQIADRVAAELADIESLSRAPTTSATTTSVSPQGTVLKVLHIKLEPENLGTVTVRLSLKDDALEMQLEASRPETADLLARDRDALSNLMRSAGYSIDTTSVATAARPDSGSNSGTSSSPGGQPQGDLPAQQQGSSGSERRGNEARNQQQPETRDILRTTDTETHETGNRTRGSGAMYV